MGSFSSDGHAFICVSSAHTHTYTHVHTVARGCAGFGFPVTFLAALMASVVICYEVCLLMSAVLVRLQWRGRHCKAVLFPGTMLYLVTISSVCVCVCVCVSALLPCSFLVCSVQVTFFLLPKFLALGDDVGNLIGELVNKSSMCDGSGEGSGGESNGSAIDKLLEDQQRIVNIVKGKKKVLMAVKVSWYKGVSIQKDESSG